MVSTHPYLDAPMAVAIAHRGSAATFPENTMAAFQDAVDLGYRYIETDVHTTLDGVLVAFHDDRLDRVTNRKGLISELTWAEIAQAKVHGREAIPRFDELLAAWPELRINIDPKADDAVGLLITALKQPRVLARVCVGSFSGARLNHMRDALGPDLCTSMAPVDVARLRLNSLGLPVGRFRALAAQVPLRQYGLPIVDKLFVDKAHSRGLKVHVWTINDQATMERLLDLGVDGIMSDETALLKAVYQDRGLWPDELETTNDQIR
ncbi:MAG: glycerophosphodiester phosphodiesterase [Alphaproteobacteria bacterium]|nr:glycerophosphodiester phosphodiesterase [Alphaproteobacteria bacterium]